MGSCHFVSIFRLVVVLLEKSPEIFQIPKMAHHFKGDTFSYIFIIFQGPSFFGIQFVSFQGCIFSKQKIIRSHLKAPFKRHFDDLALHPCPQNDSALLLPGLIGRLHRHHREVGILEARGSRWKVWRVVYVRFFGEFFIQLHFTNPSKKLVGSVLFLLKCLLLTKHTLLLTKNIQSFGTEALLKFLASK